MGVLDINKDTIIPIVASKYDIIVDVDLSKMMRELFIINPDIGNPGLEITIKTAIEQLDDIGENLSNIKNIVRGMTKYHDGMRVETSSDEDMDGNIRTWILRFKSARNNCVIITITIRNRSIWYKTY